MLQEGTIAVVGDPGQVEWDFAELQTALDGAGKLLDVEATRASWWEIWLKAALEMINDGQLSDETLTALIPVKAVRLVTSTIEFIGALNRPVFIKRVQGYAPAILTEEEFRQGVVIPQIEFDFKQFAGMTGDPDLVEVVERYRDLVIAGEYLESDEGLHASVFMLYSSLDHRPMYRDRMHQYLTGLIEPVPEPEPEVLTQATGLAVAVESLEPASGLSTSLLDPPSAV